MGNLNLLYLVILVGSAQSLLHGFVILSKSKFEKIIKLPLGLSFIILGFRLLVYPFIDSQNSIFFINLDLITLLSLLLVPPLFYVYIINRISIKRSFNFYYLIHLLPFTIYFTHLYIKQIPIPFCYCYAPLISSIFYGLISLIRIKKLEKSNQERTFLIHLLIALLIIPLLIISIDYLQVYYNIFGNIKAALLPYMILTIGLFILSFKAQKNSKLYIDNLIMSPLNLDNSVYENEIKNVLHIIETKKLYLNPNLSLQILSEHTNISRHKLSSLFNKGMNKTFNDVVNEFRVKSVCSKLSDPEYNHLSITGIAMNSGYNSKSTFIKYFKEYKKITPSEFKKQNFKQI